MIRILPSCTRAALCALAALSTACGLADFAGRLGDLGNGTFTYTCDSDGDALCDDGATSHVMPERVALSARFSGTFNHIPGTGSAIVEPAANSFVTQTETFGASFLARRPGVVAPLARTALESADLEVLEIAPAAPAEPLEEQAANWGFIVIAVAPVALAPADAAARRSAHGAGREPGPHRLTDM